MTEFINTDKLFNLTICKTDLVSLIEGLIPVETSFAVAAVVVFFQHRQVPTEDSGEKFFTNPQPQDFQRHCMYFSGYCVKHSLQSAEGLDLLPLPQGVCCTLLVRVFPINHKRFTYFCLCSRGRRSLPLLMYSLIFAAF